VGVTRSCFGEVADIADIAAIAKNTARKVTVDCTGCIHYSTATHEDLIAGSLAGSLGSC